MSKRHYFLASGFWLLALTPLHLTAQSTTQWVNIMRSFSDKERTDTSGYFFIPTPNNYTSAQLLNDYLAISGDTLSSFVRTRQWTDSFVKHHHYEYQHYFMGIPVVAGIVREHFNKDGLYLIHGKIGLFDGVDTLNLELLDPPDLAVNIFLRSHFGYPVDTIYYFAWQDTAWENQLKRDLEDSTATWFPTAKLVWVTPELGYTPGPYLRNLKLAYEIRVFCLRPFFDRTYYVNAFKPWEVILFIDNIHTHNNSRTTTTNSCQQGYALADVWYHGRRCIDIYKGVLKQKLIANDDGHDFETRYYEPYGSLITLIKTPSVVWAHLRSIGISIFQGNWVGKHGEATSAHWFVQASWDYFRDFHYFEISRTLRTIIQVPNFINAISKEDGGFYYLIFGEDTANNFFSHRALDIVAHEFTHHIIRETTNLYYFKESGAINEAISDIFASVVEHWIEGSGASWELGELATNDPMLKRSLQNPKSLGFHDTPGPGCLYDLGQPDTYHGQYWYDVTSPDSCDNWGVHINSGVINYWFYLISRGGSGTNDHGWNYTVNPLPSEFKAAKIVFNALENYLTPSATFHDFRIATLLAEKDSFNVCAYQKTIKQAWFAVGLSTDTVLEQPCNLIDNVSVLSNKPLSIRVIHLNKQYKLLTNKPVKVAIYNTTGKMIKQLRCNYSCELNLHGGLFLFKVWGDSHNYKTFKLVINK